MISEIKLFFFSAFYEIERERLKRRFEKVEDFLGDRELKILHKNIQEAASSNQQWMERIATVVNKSRVPKDWSDEDVADFKFKIAELSMKFLGIETIASSNCVLLKDRRVEEILKKIENLSSIQRMAVLRVLVAK